MRQYLLSIYQPDGEPPPAPVLEKVMQTTNQWLAAILCGGVLSVVLSAQNPSPHRDCAGLTNLTLPDIKISEAVTVPAATSGQIRAAHCRVTGVIGTEIRFSLLLPDTWNGKFMLLLASGLGLLIGRVRSTSSRLP